MSASKKDVHLISKKDVSILTSLAFIDDGNRKITVQQSLLV